MGKKKERKEKRTKTPREIKPTHGSETPTEEEDDKTDFGGFPNRDLRKNLGCG